ncbi:MAG TPA: lycopene cyclase, partial [Gammaproteobacteria bacterium]|nr:lycopene cyclase [Gammaproteobacteria bacterium]
MPAFLETDYDLAIIGAGMSGLSLAAHLSEAAQRSSTALPKTIVIDPRTDYSADKTWCYWQQASTPFDQAIT